jgi:hypothetical protein
MNMKTMKKTTVCERCGAVQRGEWDQGRTCRNVEACKRRAARRSASEPHQVSEGGTPEDAAYWERRNALQPRVAR